MLADLEAQLLDDLATAGTTAASIDAGFAACRPVVTHVLASPGALVAAKANLGALRQAGVPLGDTIVSPNMPADRVILLSSPAVELYVRQVLIGRQNEPALVGESIAAWTWGWAAVGSQTAVQVVDVVP